LDNNPGCLGDIDLLCPFVVKNVFNLQVSAVKNVTTEGFDSLPALANAPVQINVILPAVLVITLVLFVTFVMLYIRQQKLRMKAENKILVQQNQSFASQKSLNEMEMNAIQRENETLNNKLEARRREVTNLALNIAEQRAFFSDLAEKIDSAINEDNPDLHKGRLNELALMVRQRMTFSKETEELFGQIELLQRDFQMKLESEFPGLTLQDKRLATFLRLNLSSKEIASLMNITPKSVEIARYRFRKKLNLSPGINLNQYLSNI
jgi:inorganic phosphate transporter, PiT family